ncbi:MAG: DUF4384 domain-containing protein, partial [Gemmatimonadota bacterium]|nr:DUF4384 domain-containing protein [Gemmatimonadota bacterium]
MRNLILLAALLSLGASPAAAAEAAVHGNDLEVEVWAENDRDYFHSGDPLHVRFRTSESAYVAVIHLSTSGEVEFLYPRSPWDDGYVRGRRSYSLPAAGSYARWSARGPSGIGYVYVVASEEPLDFSAFRDRYGHDWSFWKLGRAVRGDPYYALDRITEQLVRDPEYAGYAVDYFTYHVGRRHSYPRYACYDGYGYGGQGWGEYYYSCDRLRVLLGSDPYYYDGHYRRRYRGYGQRTYLADAHRAEPRYRYKERTAAERGDAPPLRAGSYGNTGNTGDASARTRPETRVRPEPEAREEGAAWRDDQQEPRT